MKETEVILFRQPLKTIEINIPAKMMATSTTTCLSRALILLFAISLKLRSFINMTGTLRNKDAPFEKL